MRATPEHRAQVVRLDAQGQVEHRAGLEELRREAGVGAEHQRVVAVDEAEVEVRHRHRRCADGGLAVDLRLVAADQLGRAGAQELAADREAAEAGDLRDARPLQQRQGAAAGTDEDEAGADRAPLAGDGVADGDRPPAVGLPRQPCTRWLRWTATPRASASSNSIRVRAPKFTSVPAADAGGGHDLAAGRGRPSSAGSTRRARSCRRCTRGPRTAAAWRAPGGGRACRRGRPRR